MNPFDQPTVMNQFSRLFLVAGLALLFAACGGGGGQPSETADASETTSSPDTIEIAMTDYAYEPSTITIPAGQQVTLQFTNDGSVEHYFVVGDSIASTQDGFRQNLFSGVSLTKNKQTEGHEEEEEEEHEEEGGHENVFELPPGGSGSMTFTLPESKAGMYTIACFETTGGEVHRQLGMEGTLTVTASSQ
jgi:uncharacterized cupredoxin-like copper-binding protein